MERVEVVRMVTFIGGAVTLVAASIALRGGRPEGTTPQPSARADEIAAPVEPETDEPGTCACTAAPGVGITEREHAALERACADAETDEADDHCSDPWSVFATLPNTVVLKRSTGECGGCG